MVTASLTRDGAALTFVLFSRLTVQDETARCDRDSLAADELPLLRRGKARCGHRRTPFGCAFAGECAAHPECGAPPGPRAPSRLPSHREECKTISRRHDGPKASATECEAHG